MSLNPNAKPFTFNAGASSFVPSNVAFAKPKPQSAASPPPKPATSQSSSPPPIAQSPVPIAASPSPSPPPPPPSQAQAEAVTESWEELETQPQPQAIEETKTAATTAPSTDALPPSSPPVSSPDASNVKTDSAVDGTVDDVMPLDEDEAKELAEAEEEEKRAALAKKKAGGDHKVHDEREPINIVFIGHVDAGKSTISGQILLLTGQVDERTIAKYEKEAKEKNRESWYLAYIMDTNEEERAKGKTVEVGRAHFETTKKRFTLLDAPGHKNYVPNMIGGASQADIAVLVISARRGEFEAGFDRGGQTREHAMLAKTLGIVKLVVLVNKMDEKDVRWSKERYDQIEGTLTPFLKKSGFSMKDVVYIPASGFNGMGIKDPVPVAVCPWYTERKSLFQILDEFPPMPRDPEGGLRLPIMVKYKDMGSLCVLGKLESGTLRKDTKLLMMPNKIEVQCTGITIDDIEVSVAKPGENIVCRLKGCEEEEVQEGFVLSYPDRPCKRTALFEAKVSVADLLEHKPIITSGYAAVLHVHCLAVECVITKIVGGIDKKTGGPSAKVPKLLRSNDFAIVRIKLEQSIAVETFEDFAPLGRFTLRDEGKTIAIGKILRIKEEP